jgi:hypothetical protein
VALRKISGTILWHAPEIMETEFLDSRRCLIFSSRFKLRWRDRANLSVTSDPSEIQSALVQCGRFRPVSLAAFTRRNDDS